MIEIKNLGLIEYKQAWDIQQDLFTKVQNGDAPSTILLCQHPHVYTLGKSGEQNNLLISPEFLARINATFYNTDRGGDITYHGPGQIVAYPILNLKELNLGLREYINKLEQSVIDTLALFNITAERLEKATGVWIEGNRKICAIGVKVSRSVTMHGLALNVTTDLKYFSYINPCGFVDKSVTSIEKETGQIEPNILDKTIKELSKQLLRTFAPDQV